MVKKTGILLLLCIVVLNMCVYSFAVPGDKDKSNKINQFGIELGILSGSVSYAHKFSKNWLWGLNLGYVWEDNLNTFDTNIWEVFHGEFFTRFQSSYYFNLDLGASAFIYSPCDECDEKGFFAGGYVRALIGYKFIFLAPHIRMGVTSDYRGTELGAIFTPLVVKLVITF